MSQNEDYLDSLLNSVTSFKEELDLKSGLNDKKIAKELEDLTDMNPEFDPLMEEAEDDDSFLSEFEKELLEDDDLFPNRKAESEFVPNEFSDAEQDKSFFDDIDNMMPSDALSEEAVSMPEIEEVNQRNTARAESVPEPVVIAADEEETSEEEMPQEVQEETAAAVEPEVDMEPQADDADEGTQIELPEGMVMPEDIGDGTQTEEAEGEDEQELLDLLSGLSENEEISELSDLLKADEEDIPVAPEESEEEAVDEDAPEGEAKEAADLLKQEVEEAKSEKKALKKEKKAKDKKSKKEKKEKKKKEKSEESFFDRLKRILFGDDDEEEEEEAVDIPEEQMTNLSDENLEILKQLDGEEGKEAEEDKKGKKDKKKKKEKKEKKPKKEKPPKEKKPKEKKPKKEKKPREKLPPVPKGPLIAGIILGVSIFALVYVFTTLTGTERIMTKAEKDFYAADYILAFEDIEGMTIAEDDEETQNLYRKIQLMAFICKHRDNFYLFEKQELYEDALDSLLRGAKIYDKYADEANNLEIGDLYNTVEQEIEQRLEDTYRLDKDAAAEIYSITDRQEYTDKVYEVVENLGLVSKSIEQDSE
ncbi:MAG: hypothetical protein K6G01_02700 [Eubacterium sp.]|nr:hypothetical protein [Eubacterium sp.]